MTQTHIGWCGELKLNYIESEKLLSRNKRVGYIVFKDASGSINPFYTYEANSEGSLVFPAMTINDQEYDMLTATSVRLTELYGQAGILTITYALQPDGTDFAVVNITEGVCEQAACACKAFGIDADDTLCKLRSEPNMAFLGYIPAPDRSCEL